MSVSPAEEPPTPLSQDEHSQKVVATINSLCSDPETILNCPFCNLEIRDKSPTWSIAYSHFLDSHSLHIDRISKIVDLKEYLRHIGSSMEPGQNDTFFQLLPKSLGHADGIRYLGPKIPWDFDLRERLRLRLLNQLIDAQRTENAEVAERTCLHCSHSLNGTVKDICDHMFEEHGFSVGLPDNLVHLPRLLNILKTKLDHLQCFYCEHIFKSTKVLKEHMRKKKHWRIPQSKPLYDQFYIVTYSSADTEQTAVEDPEDEAVDDEEEEWVGWNDDDDSDTSTDRALCIYCPSTFHTPDQCFTHMSTEHGFDFFKHKHALSLSSYQCISWLNCARRSFNATLCIVCNQLFESSTALLSHMAEQNHFHPPKDSNVFNDQSFIIPTIEGDILLTGVDEDEESEAEERDLN